MQVCVPVKPVFPVVFTFQKFLCPVYVCLCMNMNSSYKKDRLCNCQWLLCLCSVQKFCIKFYFTYT